MNNHQQLNQLRSQTIKTIYYYRYQERNYKKLVAEEIKQREAQIQDPVLQQIIKEFSRGKEKK
jgi:hypothetical protein